MPTRPRPFPSADPALEVPVCPPAPTAAPRRGQRTLGLLLVAALLTGACSPYPDDGEFLAGVVFAANFISGVKQLDMLPAVGRGQGAGSFAPYTVIATTQGMNSPNAVTSMAAASSPLWTDGKRKPLDRKSAQPVYVLDSACVAPVDYRFDERLDLIRQDRQYPIFADIPELLSTNAGKAGRTAAYSAIVEVIHLTAPTDLPCQSIKRFDTAQGRIGLDLTEGRHEYRLLQIIDPGIALSPLPVQLGFYNQLVVPYLDLGPVPLSSDGTTFVTMPLYKATDKNKKTQVVVAGTALEPAQAGGAAYSPICQDYTLTMLDQLPPPDATDPAYRGAKKTEALASCLVCRTLDAAGHLSCPFAQSQVAP